MEKQKPPAFVQRKSSKPVEFPTAHFFSDGGQCRLRLRGISLVRRGASSVGLHVVFAAWRRRKETESLVKSWAMRYPYDGLVHDTQ